jgi:hypothetical protein
MSSLCELHKIEDFEVTVRSSVAIAVPGYKKTANSTPIDKYSG